MTDTPRPAAPERVTYRPESFTRWCPTAILHGIKLTEEGDPILPCLGPLMELAVANKWCFEFDWNEEDRKWTAIHSDMNQS